MARSTGDTEPVYEEVSTDDLEKTRELIGIQAKLSSGHNRNATRLIPREIQYEHGQGAVDTLIREFDSERIFELEPGTDFSNVA